MNNNKMDAVEITITIKGKNKNSELKSIIPLTIAEKINIELIDWQNRYLITPSAYETFLENKKTFNNE